jgi:FKBP-type peptidyl-prolyl cis-trans isomerase FklB
MKIWLGALLAIAIVASAAHSADAPALKTQKEKTSYAIGVDIGSMLSRQPVDVDIDTFLRGAGDALRKKNLLLNDQEIKEILTGLQKEMMAKQEERIKTLGEKNRKDGEAFLADNKKKEGMKTLPSGLQYKVIKEGTGKMPKATDTVTTNYRGTLIDGTEFDSSYKRGQPATFPVNGVIKGWTEALQLMKTGSKWQLFVPSDLAYGDKGAGPQIGPNSTLVFEVELLSVQ